MQNQAQILGRSNGDILIPTKTKVRQGQARKNIATAKPSNRRFSLKTDLCRADILWLSTLIFLSNGVMLSKRIQTIR